MRIFPLSQPYPPRLTDSLTLTLTSSQDPIPFYASMYKPITPISTVYMLYTYINFHMCVCENLEFIQWEWNQMKAFGY